MSYSAMFMPFCHVIKCGMGISSWLCHCHQCDRCATDVACNSVTCVPKSLIKSCVQQVQATCCFSTAGKLQVPAYRDAACSRTRVAYVWYITCECSIPPPTSPFFFFTFARAVFTPLVLCQYKISISIGLIFMSRHQLYE